jgi:hypothetical protein
MDFFPFDRLASVPYFLHYSKGYAKGARSDLLREKSRALCCRQLRANKAASAEVVKNAGITAGRENICNTKREQWSKKDEVFLPLSCRLSFCHPADPVPAQLGFQDRLC